MAKINTRNVALVIAITVLDIGAGLYDRLYNGIGVIDGILRFMAAAGNSPVSPMSTTVNMTMMGSIGSSTNFLALGLFILAAVFVIGLLASVLGGMSARA